MSEGNGNDQNEVLVDLIAGWASGAVSIICCQPIDTILTRIQAKPLNFAAPKAHNIGGVTSQQFRWNTTLPSSASSVSVRSIPSFGSGLWRGSFAMIGAIPIQNSLLMAGYGYGKRVSEQQYPDSPNLFGVFIGGIVGGILQSFLMSPVELIKVNQQVHTKTSFTSASQEVVLGIFRKKVAWRGLEATLLRDGIPHGVWFASYEYMKSLLSQELDPESKGDNSSIIALSSGSFAAFTAWLVGYPFDLIKTRIQVSGGNQKGIMDTAKDIIRESNGRPFAGLYRGFGLKLAKAVPSSAINFFVYEKAVSILSS